MKYCERMAELSKEKLEPFGKRLLVGHRMGRKSERCVYDPNARIWCPFCEQAFADAQTFINHLLSSRPNYELSLLATTQSDMPTTHAPMEGGDMSNMQSITPAIVDDFGWAEWQSLKSELAKAGFAENAYAEFVPLEAIKTESETGFLNYVQPTFATNAETIENNSAKTIKAESEFH